MKLWLSALLLIGMSVNLSSCKKDDEDNTVVLTGTWTQEPSIDAGARSRAVVFNIDNKIYITTGFNGTNGNVFLNDLWVYDNNGTWIQKKSLPSDTLRRTGAVAFTANGKGYIGLGYNGTKYLKDFWSYDPATDEWTKVSKDFPGDARAGAIAFSIDNKGYVGTGYNDDKYLKDFYMYDESKEEKWILKASVPLTERANAFSFVIGEKGYVGGGTYNLTKVEDMYAYDPLLNTWTAKNNLKEDDDADPNDDGYTISREQAATFVIGDFAYVVGGRAANNSGSFLSPNNETWEYNAPADMWKKKIAYKGIVRFGAIGYTLNGAGYVGGGTNGAYFTDNWRFNP